ncbi:MAG: hypothetical protein K2K00_04680 [Muribaculaceae bacterium]|nr:hypothetical protein [Muribaculaceae bacterium]
MSALTDFYLKTKSLSTISAASVMAFVGPVVPYGAICTAMIVADLLSARMLARRVRRRAAAGATCEALKFSSRRFGATVVTLVKTYALLLLAHGVDVVIIDDAPLSLLRFCAALICFWQLWSILENESSANSSTWARIAQRILIDKTERHLGIDLRDLKPKNLTK